MKDGDLRLARCKLKFCMNEVSMCPARRTVNGKSMCPASVNHVSYRLRSRGFS